MRKILLLGVIVCLNLLTLHAQEKLYIHQTTGISDGVFVNKLDSMVFEEDDIHVRFYTPEQSIVYPLWRIDSLAFGADSRKIEINYSGKSVKVKNALAFEGVTVTTQGGHIVVNSVSEEEIEYVLSGTATDGSFKIYSNKKFILTLKGVEITSSDGPAINIQSGKKVTVNLTDNTSSTLVDGTVYTPYEKEDMKAAFFSEGQLIFNGTGALTVYGNYRHGICSDDYIVIESGTINIPQAVTDGLHANDYIEINGGKITINASGDGIDGDSGYIEINGGDIDITVKEDTNKGIKCDDVLKINGGNVTINTSGNVVVSNNDPSYCTAIKGKSDVIINDGNILIKSTGTAGKGISVDGDFYINGGIIDITASGNGGTYTNTSNQRDSYSSNCLKSDGEMYITGGTITTHSSGTGGKGISVDGNLIIGGGSQTPIFNVTTTGARFSVSGQGNNANYTNSKAIKSKGNLTIHKGEFIIRTFQNGAEGIESKATLTINGGNFDIETYDDGLNASNHIEIGGGQIYSYSSGNDGIDSNGTLTITGGIVIAIGTDSPEAGLDCDNSTFKITGGTIVGVGGSTSTPTSNVCTQRTIIYSGTGTANQLVHIRSASNEEIITFKIPGSYSRGMTLLVSQADVKANTAYTLYTGGSVSGGTEFHGLYIDSNYTAGTSTSSFTTSSNSMVTTVNGSSGGGSGGWGCP